MKTTLAKRILAWLAIATCCAVTQLHAATSTIYSNDFEGYTNTSAVTSDTGDFDPTGIEWNVSDDAALLPNTAGAGVQVISWLTNSAGAATKCLLLNPATEAQVYLSNSKSGSRYTIDFNLLVGRGPTSSHNFYIVLRGMGSDYNGQDWIAYRGDRTTNSHRLNLYDGTKSAPGWVTSTATHLNHVWQHHRIVVDPNVPSTTLYIDDMTVPILSNVGIARSEIAMPTLLRLINEANTSDDGFYAIDDFSITVENAPDLTTTFTDGFESYTARTSPADDADPAGPWITTEYNGTADGGGRPAAPVKVQVVNPSAEGLGFAARSGSKCLKVEYGQRAGVTLGWGATPSGDVKLTWWARVPMSVKGQQANYLRFSLYGAEGDNTYSGDAALLGYGSRDGTIGDETSLTYYTTAWRDTRIDYTPDTWEEYQIITHNNYNSYSLIKSPSSSPVTIVDHAPYIGGSLKYGPMFMAGWSSSNGTNHPPAYIDDVQVTAIPAETIAMPYKPVLNSDRFTNFTQIDLGAPVGAVAVDPRDNSTILFTLDFGTPVGAIYKANKVASGNWVVSPTPVVTNLANPSGLTVGADGTIWWVHDLTQSLMRLKAPWDANVPERVIADFGNLTVTNTVQDDDTFDVCIAPSGFTGSLGAPGRVVVMDRGLDADAPNALSLVDPSTTTTNQGVYKNYLIDPTVGGLGTGDLVALTPVPPDKVATLCVDGQVTAVDASGVPTIIWPSFYPPIGSPMEVVAMAADPTTGRFWIAEDLMDQVYSCDSLGTSQPEITFTLNNPAWTGRNIDFHDPGMTFSPDGKLLVISDGSMVNGGGRLFVFHSEPIMAMFKITRVTRTGQETQLNWESAGSFKYNVMRGTSLTDPGSFVNISGDITATSYTDTSSANGPVFYRVVAKP